MDPRPPDPDELDAADCARLGALHVACIGDSLPALLGAGFCTRLYALLDRSSSEYVLCERVAGTIESAVVVSIEPGSLYRRIARATWPQLVPAAARALLESAAFRRQLAGTVRDALVGRGGPQHAPEITYAFTSEAWRSRHLGQRLVERVDTLLAGLGFDAYFVKTLDEPANRAVDFYQRAGFERIAAREAAGRRFVEFRKRLG